MTDFDPTIFTSEQQAKAHKRRNQSHLPCGYEGCTKLQWARGYCDNHYQKLKREGILQRVVIRGNVLRRFYASFDVNPETLCWEWKSHVNQSGYGYLSIGRANKKILAHRYSYELFHGAIPDGKKILHHCDVKICTNPSHVYAGTEADNMRDCIARGRFPQWEGRNKRRLSWPMATTVRILYARGDASILELSVIHGVDHELIGDIVKGRSYLTPVRKYPEFVSPGRSS